MKRSLAFIIALSGALWCACAPAHAQFTIVVLSTCGSPPLPLPTGTGFALFTDVNGNLCSSATLSGGVTVPSSGPTGSAVPAQADYGGINIGGTLRGRTGVNPTGTVYAAQTDISSWAGTVLGAPSAYGTGPGAVTVPGVNAAVTTSVLPTNAAQETGGNLATTVTDLGPPGATACATDTSSCSLNQLAQRQAQRLSTINTTLGSPFQAGASIANTSFGATLPTAATIAAGNGVVTAPSAEAGAGLSTVACSALCANQIIKGSAGNLYSFNVSADATLSGAAWWVMIYNATTAPGDGTVTPAKCYAMPSGTTSYSAAFPVPVALGTGITIGVSTTGCFTKTASTHAFISGDYK